MGDHKIRQKPQQSSSQGSFVRQLFTETPYAFARCYTSANSHCGFCGRSTTALIACEKECRRMSYCSVDCAIDDQSMHETECGAFIRGKKPDLDPTVDLYVRLLGRLLKRFSEDHGRKHLPYGIPPTKNQTFYDLIHRSDVQDTGEYEHFFEPVQIAFRAFFEGTPLNATAENQLRLFFVSAIYYSVEVIHAAPHKVKYVGNAVYLVTSQIGRSCDPKCSYQFDGNKIKISTMSEQMEPGPITADEFDSLTVCFLCGPEFGYRIDQSDQLNSLKRSPVQCKCDRCNDKTAVDWQMNAAFIECKCRSPFIWSTVKGEETLKRSCECGAIEDDSVIAFIQRSVPKVISLVERWAPVMTAALKALNTLWNATTVRERLTAIVSLYDLAMDVWDHRRNVRLGLLCEVAFRLWDAIRQREEIRKEDLNSMINYAEIAINVYQSYLNPHALTIATLAVRLARLLADRNLGDDMKRAREFYNRAMEIFTGRREENLAEKVRNELMALKGRNCQIL